MKQNIEIIIANTLANIYDWDSENLREDFISFLYNEYNIEKNTLANIFDSFDALSPLVKDSASFNLNEFVSNKLN